MVAERTRISTYVDGFDRIIGGGIPPGHVVLVAGTPGTMKSSLAYYILYHNADRGNNGLYVSLEQSKTSLLSHMEGLGLDTAAVKDRLSILDLAALRKTIDERMGEEWINIFNMYTETLKSSLDYRLFVLDSIDILEILAGYDNIRIGIFKLFQWLRALEVTSFVITEIPPDLLGNAPEELRSAAYSKHDEDFLADGIVHLVMTSMGEVGMRRLIRCVKLRGVKHYTGYMRLMLADGRFDAEPISSV